MNDDQLIELVRQKSPEDLTPDEIDLLRTRLAESAELREVLVGQMRMESYLAEALGPATVSVDAILRRASDEQTPRGGSLQVLLVIASSLALLVLVVGVFVAAWLARPNDDGRPVAKARGLGNSGPEQAETPVPAGENSSTGKSATNVARVAPEAGKLPLTIEAENFSRGNVLVDSTEWGTADLQIVRTGESPAFAEYEFQLAEAGKLALRLRYASFDSRPLRLAINGQMQPQIVAGEQTGGHAPSAQKWFAAGEFDFQKGKNVIRLETTANFPHLDQLVVGPADPAAPLLAGQRPSGVAERAAPWREVLDRAGDQPPFAEVCFDNFRTDKSLPQRDDLHRWFAPVDGQRYRVYDNRTRIGQCGAFEGLIRLKAPWQNDSALKLSLEGYDRLQLHFFAGAEGVTFVYHEADNFRWSAYATTRKANSPKPDKFVLAATDETRNRRSEIRFGGPFELRHRDGELILSRGDVVFCRVPFANAPQDVYFDGKASFHGIAFLRTQDFPAVEPPRPTTMEIARPADLAWIKHIKPGARVEVTPEGAVELRADRAQEKGYIAAPLDALGLKEVIFEIDDASPGAGVFLGRKNGEPIEVLRFMRNQRDGGLCLSMRSWDDAREADFASPMEKLVPAATGRVWLKMLVGAGTMRWWMSTDGTHWVQPEYPREGVAGGFTHVGLQYVQQTPDCRIRLKKIELREFSEIPALTTAELRASAPAIYAVANHGEWLDQADKARPEKVDPQDWRRACAVKSLSAGCGHELGWKLVESLLDSDAARNLPLDRQLRLLDEAVLLCDLRWSEPIGFNLFSRYANAGLAAFDTQGARPFTSIRHRVMTAPFSNQLNLNVRQTCEGTIRAELVQLLYAGQWEETQRFCERLRFYKQDDQLPLVEWAEYTARRNSPARPGADSIGRQREEWRHPYSEQLNKETYNILAELQSILESDALNDAARMITSIDASAVSGVAPQGGDRDLFVSLPAAVRMSLRKHPALETLIKEQFGPLAQLRIRTAISENNIAAVQLAAVQFESTQAAAEAHRWLGDRALSSGWFSRALAEYRRAEATAEASVLEELAQRIRLAGAMMGADLGQPVSREVKFGETRMTAGEFEALIAEMKGRAGTPGRSAASRTERFAPSAPPPTGFEAQRRGKVEGPVGDSPGSEVTRNTNRFRTDWVGRQLATAVEGDSLFVSNRFQVAAYDLTNGNLKWRGLPPPGKIMRAQDWTFTSMRPLVTQKHVIARQLFGNGPLLACFDKESGHYVWSSEQRQNEFLVSDPVLLQDQLVALTLARIDQRESVLRLTYFDIETGDVLAQHPLIELQESWFARKYCEILPLDDALVVALGGVVVCADLSGNVRWVRRQIVLPVEEEASWILQHFDRPLLHEGRLFLAQPGVRSIECLDPDTGARLWNVVLPSMQRIVGICEKQLIVQTDGDLRALDLVSGERRWTHKVGDLLTAQACGGGILYSRRETGDEKNAKVLRPRLVWLDPSSGETRGSSGLAGLEDSDPRLGPFVAHGDKSWTFFGKGPDPNRDLIELVPKGAADK